MVVDKRHAAKKQETFDFSGGARRVDAVSRMRNTQK